ncbi:MULTISPECIES: hypothetical protein [Sphingopyxis]|jgi:hypothetical protein|uniref:SIS domain-containing protein n=1 Tax=Sphingopyxis indica TaxID=436663 RepID=A0A239K8S0_9SPHN|nr:MULTISPECIES: hypothetical protein [Sphingopyxis]KTE18374.1 hypothetical protein ATE67_18700 [Sphingopyxis sp. H050]SNT14777.1 hypothetical protein SAMN06295955_11348 [Sphingopyxis indica]
MNHFRDRVDSLPLTIKLALSADVKAISEALQASGDLSVLTIGSGGSLVTAGLLARTIEGLHGNVARSLTPLEFIAAPTLGNGKHVWLISAEGTNPDILAALDAAVKSEASSITVLCNREASMLVEAARDYGSTVLLYETDSQKDGFLATHTLLLSATLICRAAGQIAGSPVPPRWVDPVLRLGRSAATDVLSRSTVIIAFDPLLVDAARLIETNFWEAALINVEAVDFRNFAHGRHLWAAKRGGELGLIALLTDQTRVLWADIAGELPAEVAKAELDFGAPREFLPIDGLMSAMELTGQAGEILGVDPGRPGVPDFGRRIYHVPSLLLQSQGVRGMSPSLRKAAARRRLVGISGLAEEWADAEQAFRERGSSMRFHGLVLDYDGTVVRSSERRQPPRDAVLAGLIRFLDEGGRLAFATGRGDSVGAMLRKVLPERHWPEILVGYYNGGLCIRLDEAVDKSSIDEDVGLSRLAEVIEQCAPSCGISVRRQRVQLCLTAVDGRPLGPVRDFVLKILEENGLRLRTYVSGHSIDVLAPGVDKENVARRLADAVNTADAKFLRIGDSGGYPGNDFALLKEDIGLSVDRVSDDPNGCWNLLPPGVKGPDGLVAYLDRINSEDGSFAIDLMTL